MGGWRGRRERLEFFSMALFLAGFVLRPPPPIPHALPRPEWHHRQVAWLAWSGSASMLETLRPFRGQAAASRPASPPPSRASGPRRFAFVALRAAPPPSP